MLPLSLIGSAWARDRPHLQLRKLLEAPHRSHPCGPYPTTKKPRHTNPKQPQIKTCNLTPLALMAPKTQKAAQGQPVSVELGQRAAVAVDIPVIKSTPRPVGFFFQGSGWAASLPARCFPCLIVFAAGTHAWPEDSLRGSAQESLSPACSAYVGWTKSDFSWNYWVAI